MGKKQKPTAVDDYDIKPQYLLQDAIRLDENLGRYAKRHGIKKEDVGQHLKETLGDDIDRALSLLDLKKANAQRKNTDDELESNIARKNKRRR